MLIICMSLCFLFYLTAWSKPLNVNTEFCSFSLLVSIIITVVIMHAVRNVMWSSDRSPHQQPANHTKSSFASLFLHTTYNIQQLKKKHTKDSIRNHGIFEGTRRTRDIRRYEPAPSLFIHYSPQLNNKNKPQVRGCASPLSMRDGTQSSSTLSWPELARVWLLLESQSRILSWRLFRGVMSYRLLFKGQFFFFLSSLANSSVREVQVTSS